MSIDLDGRYLRDVREILREHVPGCEVWAFGSRVQGHAKRFSDLDVALLSSEPLPVRRLALLAEAFAESDLPIKVDLLDWSSASEDFRRLITEGHEVLVPSAMASAKPI